MEASADNLLEAERKAAQTIAELHQMEESYSMAKQVAGLRDDRIKKSLAVLVAEFIRKGDSATAAEWKARADKRFKGVVEQIMQETADAVAICLHWDVEKLKFENAQAMRNDERAKLKLL